MKKIQEYQSIQMCVTTETNRTANFNLLLIFKGSSKRMITKEQSYTNKLYSNIGRNIYIKIYPTVKDIISS